MVSSVKAFAVPLTFVIVPKRALSSDVNMKHRRMRLYSFNKDATDYSFITDDVKASLQMIAQQRVLQQQSWTGPVGGDFMAAITHLEGNASFLEEVDALLEKEELCVLDLDGATPVDNIELLVEVIADTLEACVIETKETTVLLYRPANPPSLDVHSLE